MSDFVLTMQMSQIYVRLTLLQMRQHVKELVVQLKILTQEKLHKPVVPTVNINIPKSHVSRR